VLFAPSSGEETRDYLLGSAREGLDNAVSQGRRWRGQARKAAATAKQKFNDVTDAGVEAFDEARGA